MPDQPRTFDLGHSVAEWWDWGVRITFADGASACGTPHDDAFYRAHATLKTRSGDVLDYAHEHDTCHLWLWPKLFGGPSAVLWGLAHGEPADELTALYEEGLIQAAQAWFAHGHLEWPMALLREQGVDIEALREEWRSLLGG